jgi:glucose-1-phosphate thymidylyltransferase
VVAELLLPVFDKPMIYYPLSALMLANINEILIISTPEDLSNFEKLLGNGNEIGIKLSYKVQPSPDGLAQAFILGEDFIGNDDVCLVLGDNIFYGSGFSGMLQSAKNNLLNGKSTVFGYYVNDPQRYGIAEFDTQGNILSIEEKPNNPTSNYAVVGLYFYKNDVIKIAKNVSPSERGELEITSINQEYLKQKKLKIELLGRGFSWLDTGTHDSLLEAGQFIKSIEKRKGLKVACIEEIAFRMGYIDASQLIKLASPLKKNGYGKYLLNILK